MDWADDIAYAVHDIEDFYQASVVPLPQLGDPQSPERAAFLDYASTRLAEKGVTRGDCLNALDRLTTDALFPMVAFRGTRDHREALLEWSDQLISRYIEAFTVGTSSVEIPKLYSDEVELLKQLTWCFVVDHPGLATAQRGQRHIIRQLLTALDRWVDEAKEERRLPAPLQQYLAAIERDQPPGYTPADRRRRAVADYVASLTEGQAIQLFDRLEGHIPPSVLEHWLHS